MLSRCIFQRWWNWCWRFYACSVYVCWPMQPMGIVGSQRFLLWIWSWTWLPSQSRNTWPDTPFACSPVSRTSSVRATITTLRPTCVNTSKETSTTINRSWSRCSTGCICQTCITPAGTLSAKMAGHVCLSMAQPSVTVQRRTLASSVKIMVSILHRAHAGCITGNPTVCCKIQAFTFPGIMI